MPLDSFPSDEAIIRRCAWRARRGIGPGLTRDDLLQEARIALWLARAAGRVPQGDELHAARYLAKRAYGAMIDASRAAWGQWPIAAEELSELHDVSDDSDRPDTRAQLAQALEQMGRRCSARVSQCIALIASGSSHDEVAAEMGVTASRVSQLLHEARRHIVQCC